MWKVREAKKIGMIPFWEVYQTMPTGETIFRGKWKYRNEAQALADKLNKEGKYADAVRNNSHGK